MKIKIGLQCVILLASVVVSSCGPSADKQATVSTDSTSTFNNANFEATLDGKQTGLYILENHNGVKAAVTNYGGRLVSLMVPDKNGKMTDVVVGFKSVQEYENSTEPYFGATIGRFGNRIAKGKFTLDGKGYTLFTNNGANTLHGGKKGYQGVVWDANKLNDSTLQLSYVSKDMEEGFPGTLNVKVTYSLTTDNGFKCDYEATTDKKTVVNITNHAFFNLNGEGSGNVLNHTVQIYADKYTPVDAGLIPTGKLEQVQGTPFDFTQPATIGARINDSANEQIKNGMGYDHNYVLTGSRVNGMTHAATVAGDQSGIVMDVYTMEPGLQFYSGNFMQSKNTFKGGTKDDFRTAFCMETQHFPDAPNQPNFPSTILNPGDTYHTSSLYTFSKGK